MDANHNDVFFDMLASKETGLILNTRKPEREKNIFVVGKTGESKDAHIWDNLKETPCPICGEKMGWLRFCDILALPYINTLLQASCRSCGYKTKKHYSIELTMNEWLHPLNSERKDVAI